MIAANIQQDNNQGVLAALQTKAKMMERSGTMTDEVQLTVGCWCCSLLGEVVLTVGCWWCSLLGAGAHYWVLLLTIGWWCSLLGAAAHYWVLLLTIGWWCSLLGGGAHYWVPVLRLLRCPSIGRYLDRTSYTSS